MSSTNLIKIHAAGAGKTYGICNEAIANCKNKRTLIVTYTNKGITSINGELKKANEGVLPINVDVMTWYTFLLREMIKPFQTEMYEINSLKSVDFSQQYGRINYKKGSGRYVNSNSDVLSNEVSKLATELNKKSKDCVIKRLEKIYSHIFFDEIQDMVGYDLDIIGLLIEKTGINITVVGDEKQSTFKTHNTSKNKNNQGTNIWKFFEKYEEQDLVKYEHNLKSRRFNAEICNFANCVYPNGNNITTIMDETTEHDGVYFIKNEDVEAYCRHFQPTVLKYDANTDTQGMVTLNFGECKGMTFDRVLIFPNGPLKDFLNKGKTLSAPEKYYVAVTRPRYSLAIAVDEMPRKFELEKVMIKFEDVNVTMGHLLLHHNRK